MSSSIVRNYFPMKSLSLLYDHFAFVDVPAYLADGLFIKHKVTVNFYGEYTHPEEPYVIILCKVRKRDQEHFLKALSEMNNKMILCGYP